MLAIPRSLIRTYATTRTIRAATMPTYRMIYGNDEQVRRETLDEVEVQREDGWVVFFRGADAILRVREEHVQSLELLDGV